MAGPRTLYSVSVHCTSVIDDDTNALHTGFAKLCDCGLLRFSCVRRDNRMTLAPQMVVSRVYGQGPSNKEVRFVDGARTCCHPGGRAEEFRYKGSCGPCGPQNDEAIEAGIARVLSLLSPSVFFFVCVEGEDGLPHGGADTDS